jgi:hypothetical protein
MLHVIYKGGRSNERWVMAAGASLHEALPFGPVDVYIRLPGEQM